MKIDAFYNDALWGLLKFRGYHPKGMIFDGYSDREPTGKRIVMEGWDVQRRVRVGWITPAVPPQ